MPESAAARMYTEFHRVIPEEPRFAAFRKLLTDTPAGDGRQSVYDNFVRRETRDPDEVTRAIEVVREVEAAEAASRAQPPHIEEPQPQPPPAMRSAGELIYDAASDMGLSDETMTQVIESANRIDARQADNGGE